MHQPLFEGTGSLRHPSERLAFWLTAIFAFPAAAIIGFFIHQSIGISQVALFVVVAMIYVTLARGRLLGSSVMVHEMQYPRVFAIVKSACAALDIPVPLVFVREDNFIPAAALGFGEPYALVLSSHWIEVFRDDELAFVIGRELGHIAAGHTRYLSLLSVNGHENAIVAAIFGAWLRRCTRTCDKVGLLCAGSLDAAVRAICVSAFHEFGRRIDAAAFAEQQREIENDPVMRWGAWLGSESYATLRIESLQAFERTPAYADAQQWFLRERNAAPPALPAPGSGDVQTVDCAGWWRRFWSFSIDLIVVLAILGSLQGLTLIPSDLVLSFKLPKNVFPVPMLRAAVVLAVYDALLVAVVGQTFGMMIAGLRVVTGDFRRPGVLRTILRYLLALFLWPFIAVMSPFAKRVYLHDHLTGTRVIAVERLMARVLATV